ncbi:LysR family transcriptional regulator [Paenibacillus sp. N3/727]|uniref:LysR family transcriptional regulator n=1 Tax=Paenibacillus sp. N3/727 TaxID=2925845 RepID=UPI001F52D40F|nr:LysR family transcriptional regulator [Paenibacillus sp. N3/727]UNK17047.1 LysR family transcriptional regulator [Paenibacillus sp. N3/727]
MELTDLKIFMSIVEEGSINRAAQTLDYVQSNVTTRMKKLEEELGVSLFHRHPKGVTLTEKGIVFREYALKILSFSEEALRALKETTDPTGPLAIGVVETVNCGIFMNILSDFQAQYPNVSLSILVGSSAELLTKVLDYQLDGAFVIGDVNSPKLTTEYMEDNELRLLTQKTEVDFPDISKMRWVIAPKGCPFRNVLEQWLLREGIVLTNTIEISSLETLLSCVRSGLASTLLPSSVLYGDFKQLGSYPIPPEYRFTKTSLVRRHDRFSTKAFCAFVEIVKKWNEQDRLNT